MLNVLYVTNPEAYLSKDGDNLVVKINDEEVSPNSHSLPEGIVTFGHMGASPALLECVERG